MIAKFNQLEQAIGYVSRGMASAEINGNIELSAVVDKQILGARTLLAAELQGTLARETRRFPEATAVFHALRGGGCYAALQCRCSGEKRRYCPRHCMHNSNRPLLLMIAPPMDAPARGEYLAKILDEIKEEMILERRRCKFLS